MPDTRTGVYAEGGLGRFDTLPGDLQVLIWDMAAQLLYVPPRLKYDSGLQSNYVYQGWAGRRTNPRFITAQQVELHNLTFS